MLRYKEQSETTPEMTRFGYLQESLQSHRSAFTAGSNRFPSAHKSSLIGLPLGTMGTGLPEKSWKWVSNGTPMAW